MRASVTHRELTQFGAKMEMEEILRSVIGVMETDQQPLSVGQYSKKAHSPLSDLLVYVDLDLQIPAGLGYFQYDYPGFTGLTKFCLQMRTLITQ